jgi:ubiquinone/menaquinone biosynthesis C-methylase UbiE
VLRRPSEELLDTDSGSPEEIAASLRDLRWFNRWFGGIGTVVEMITTVALRRNMDRISMLDVASGDGFLQAEVQKQCQVAGIQLEVALLDRAATHLPRNSSLPKVAGDALELPFRDASFDLVASSLFVHHLDSGEVVRFLSDALRVCRTAILVHDLVRHPVHLWFALAGTPLYRSRITRNDAPASVRQAYTPDEIREFALCAGAAGVEIQRHFFFRMGVIAWK